MRRSRLAILAAVAVLAATPLVRASGAPGDPLYSKQWGLGLVRAPGAWAKATGVGAVIAVVDTGVDRDHPELAGKLLPGASWIDCGAAPKPCGAWDDREGHGTHVAGIAAAPIDGRGVVGVAPDARILPVRVLNAEGKGTSEDIGAGVRWAVDHGANVINLSLGSLPVAGQAVDLLGADDVSVAVQYALDRNVVVVIAAGNESAPICDEESLVRAAGALCVGAVDRRKLHSSYSNVGYGLDVVAPGGLGSVFCDDDEDVWSTYALDQDTVCTDSIGYETLSGTSMAAPFVSGVAALMVQRGKRGLDAANGIKAGAQDLGPSGFDSLYGAGLVDAVAALNF